jgi:hypothetical protein
MTRARGELLQMVGYLYKNYDEFKGSQISGIGGQVGVIFTHPHLDTIDTLLSQGMLGVSE